VARGSSLARCSNCGAYHFHVGKKDLFVNYKRKDLFVNYKRKEIARGFRQLPRVNIFRAITVTQLQRSLIQH
jgi:hypothetical protein